MDNVESKLLKGELHN